MACGDKFFRIILTGLSFAIADDSRIFHGLTVISSEYNILSMVSTLFSFDGTGTTVAVAIACH
jgi:hypothetical protein